MQDLHRPQPILKRPRRTIDRATPPEHGVARLLNGEVIRLTDTYSTGADLLDALHEHLKPPPPGSGYPARRAFQRAYREAALRLLAPVSDNGLALAGAESLGFLTELYPEGGDFWLPFIEIQELYGAWRRYSDGTHLAILGHRIHPFYGTYAPTRTSHLELFGTWLSSYKGARDRAIDVGCGCGVMSLMLARAGFAEILGTDINPNAVESLRREIARRPVAPPITALCCDLLSDAAPANLIAFNPPWMRGVIESPLDQALYFEDGLFKRFFEQAIPKLSPDGRIVLVFSNILGLVQPGVPHPIEAELSRERLKLVGKLTRRVKPPADEHGHRRRTKEKVEIWELALA
ncbi:MAG: SAM-dependent methyltransferase [Myxococcota bacterium]|jgi:SAM-dependent methyltransferase